MGWLDEKNHEDPFVQEIDELIEWFCDKVCEPIPFHKQDQANVASRMMSVGLLRQSEWDTYKILTRTEDDEDEV